MAVEVATDDEVVPWVTEECTASDVSDELGVAAVAGSGVSVL